MQIYACGRPGKRMNSDITRTFVNNKPKLLSNFFDADLSISLGRELLDSADQNRCGSGNNVRDVCFFRLAASFDRFSQLGDQILYRAWERWELIHHLPISRSRPQWYGHLAEPNPPALENFSTGNHIPASHHPATTDEQCPHGIRRKTLQAKPTTAAAIATTQEVSLDRLRFAKTKEYRAHIVGATSDGAKLTNRLAALEDSITSSEDADLERRVPAHERILQSLIAHGI
jgi:hypothetical protein